MNLYMKFIQQPRNLFEQPEKDNLIEKKAKIHKKVE